MPNPAGEAEPRPRSRYAEEQAEERSQIAANYGFQDIATRIYYRDLMYTSEEYVQRLAIESDKIALDGDRRARLLREIRSAVDHHGGTITIRDMIDLNLARK